MVHNTYTRSPANSSNGNAYVSICEEYISEKFCENAETKRYQISCVVCAESIYKGA